MVWGTAQYKQEDFVFSAEVRSPVVLSIPHNGLSKNTFTGMYRPRRSPEFGDPDSRTWTLARIINIPTPVASMVRGLLPRTVMDYNRAVHEPEGDHACKDERLVEAHEQYHRTLAGILYRAVEGQNSKALLIDVHGFTKQPSFGNYDIILGTRHRTTITDDVDLRLARHLRKAGYRIYVPRNFAVSGEVLSGRYTVARHANEHVDAIQLEVNRRFRIGAGSTKRMVELALCLRSFIRTHIDV